MPWALPCSKGAHGAASSLFGMSEPDSRPSTGGVPQPAVARPPCGHFMSCRVSTFPPMAFSWTQELERELSPCVSQISSLSIRLPFEN